MSKRRYCGFDGGDVTVVGVGLEVVVHYLVA